MRTLVLVLTCAVVALGTLAGCGSSGTTAPPTLPPVTAVPSSTGPAKTGNFSVTLVTDVGGLHDRSFNQLAWSGLQEAHRRFGIAVAARQSPVEADYLPNLVLAAQHYSSLTIAVGYSMSHAMYTAAHQYPAAHFAMVDARPLDPTGHEVSLPNVTNLLFAEQESGYLAGQLAGLMESRHVGKASHNAIGYLGGQQIPQVDDYLAGFVAGARKADAAVRIIGQFSNSFTDTKTGASIADQQVSSGADIVFQVAGQAGAAYLQEAEKHGVYGIGVDSNQSYLGSAVITSAVKKVDVAVLLTVVQARKRRFHGGDRRFTAAQGATGIAPPAALVPAGIVSQVDAVERQIARHQIVPPILLPAR